MNDTLEAAITRAREDCEAARRSAFAVYAELGPSLGDEASRRAAADAADHLVRTSSLLLGAANFICRAIHVADENAKAKAH